MAVLLPRMRGLQHSLISRRFFEEIMTPSKGGLRSLEKIGKGRCRFEKCEK